MSVRGRTVTRSCHDATMLKYMQQAEHGTKVWRCSCTQHTYAPQYRMLAVSA
jgi:hypothetical protein